MGQAPIFWKNRLAGTGVVHQTSADEKPPTSELKARPAMPTARSYVSTAKQTQDGSLLRGYHCALRAISFKHIADVFGLGKL